MTILLQPPHPPSTEGSAVILFSITLRCTPLPKWWPADFWIPLCFSSVDVFGFLQGRIFLFSFSLARVSLTATLHSVGGILWGVYVTYIFRTHTRHVRGIEVFSICLVTYTMCWSGLRCSGSGFFTHAPMGGHCW